MSILSEDEQPRRAADRAIEFEKLRGLLKGALDSLGGARPFSVVNAMASTTVTRQMKSEPL
jgi:hypothetical protein